MDIPDTAVDPEPVAVVLAVSMKPHSVEKNLERFWFFVCSSTHSNDIEEKQLSFTIYFIIWSGENSKTKCYDI